MNEVNVLHNLINKPIFSDLTGEESMNTNNINHINISYVDDATSLISCQNIEILKKYIDKYYKLLESFYNINFLKINPDKTAFLVTCQPKHRHLTHNLTLQASNFIIRQSDTIKILGVYFTNSLNNAPNVNNIISKVNYRISILNKITQYTNFKTSKLLYNSLVVSVFTYCLPNLNNINYLQLNKLYVLWNKCAHRVLGFQSYKWNMTTIFKKLDWLSFTQMIHFESLKLFHKISFEQQPKALTKYLQHSLVRSDVARLVRKPSILYLSKTSKTSNSFLHRTNNIYNNIPDDLRILAKKKFAIEIKIHIKNNFDLKKFTKPPY